MLKLWMILMMEKKRNRNPNPPQKIKRTSSVRVPLVRIIVAITVRSVIEEIPTVGMIIAIIALRRNGFLPKSQLEERILNNTNKLAVFPMRMMIVPTMRMTRVVMIVTGIVRVRVKVKLIAIAKVKVRRVIAIVTATVIIVVVVTRQRGRELQRLSLETIRIIRIVIVRVRVRVKIRRKAIAPSTLVPRIPKVERNRRAQAAMAVRNKRKPIRRTKISKQRRMKRTSIFW